ncbi:MAG TPA: diacylglycerol kinase family protein [Acidobacteriaceae bacterium]
MRKIVLFANPLLESRGTRDLHEALQVFKEAGAEVDLRETGPNRVAGSTAKHLVEQGIDAVVVCGGDGTVFDVLQGLAGSEIPLGIIPFGTGNILAQNLHVPNKPADAARWLLCAEPRPVPLGKVTCFVAGGIRTWFFAIAAGMGLHAAMMEATERSRKGRMGRMAYFVIGLKALFSHPVQPFEMKIETVEGKTLERRVCEAIALRVAELNLWRPGGDLDFPFLRLASVEGESRWRLAKGFFEALFLRAGQRDRLFKKSDAARYENVLRVECRAIAGLKYRAPIALEADGEVLGTSCATIEMAGLSVRLLSSPMTGAPTRSNGES